MSSDCVGVLMDGVTSYYQNYLRRLLNRRNGDVVLCSPFVQFNRTSGKPLYRVMAELIQTTNCLRAAIECILYI